MTARSPSRRCGYPGPQRAGRRPRPPTSREGARGGRTRPRHMTKQERLAMLEEQREPVGSAGRGNPSTAPKWAHLVAGPAGTSFSAAKGGLLHVNWRSLSIIDCWTYDTGQYRVDAAYIAPDGHTLRQRRRHPASCRPRAVRPSAAGTHHAPGSTRSISISTGSMSRAEEVSRAGRTFAVPLPRRFVGPAQCWRPHGHDRCSTQYRRAVGVTNIPLELRLRPQPDACLHGGASIRRATAPRNPGFVGNHVEFQVRYGAPLLRRPAQCGHGSVLHAHW